jgi:hypothetical protein
METILDHLHLIAIGFVVAIIVVVIWGTLMQRKALVTTDVALEEGREHTRDAMEIMKRSLEVCEESLRLQEDTVKLLQEISAKLPHTADQYRK